jgi:hypothetical protein
MARNPLIGDQETIRDPSFIQRFSDLRGPPEKDGHVPNKVCARLTAQYEWAEYKTSLLVQEITKHQGIHAYLLQFIKDIGVRIHKKGDILDKKGGIKDSRIDLYVTQRLNFINEKKSPNDRVREHYPVSQDSLLLDTYREHREFLKDVVNGDFYIHFNYLKQVSSWIEKKEQRYTTKQCQEMSAIINQVRQRMNEVVEVYKAPRGNKKDGHSEVEGNDTQVGITNIRDDYLVRNVDHLAKERRIPPPRGWVHPGESQCRQPYHGKYGTLIRQDRERLGYYGSLKCGISGSVNFLLYLYLLSIYGDEQVMNVDVDINNIILSCCLYLAGDGGHNVREILYGLNHSCIVLDMVGREYGNIGLPDNINALFNKFFSANVRTFLGRFCTRFADINLTGVIENEIPHDVRLNLGDRFKAYTVVMLRTFFTSNRTELKNQIPNLEYLLQMYFTLDRNRYKNDNFLDSPNQIITDIVRQFGDSFPFHYDILGNVNAKLQRRLYDCAPHKRAEDIPFAFKPKK